MVPNISNVLTPEMKEEETEVEDEGSGVSGTKVE